MTRIDPVRPVRHATGRIRWPRQPRTAETGRVWGWHDRETGEISVTSEQSPPDQATILLHELLHAIRPAWSEKRVLSTEAALAESIERNPGPWLWAIWMLTRG